jgi:precorrin-6Y C5,15-methyltransferase (decarboxylating) CbiT subunit
VPDERFAQVTDGPKVLTRQEVRAASLAKCRLSSEAGDTFWDLGAGIGTVAVEMAVLRPQAEVVAVERDPERLALLQQNRERFDTHNVRVVEGEAPDALDSEIERPCRVFLGGSGGRLGDILDLVRQRLVGGGRLVANFVTLEHLTSALQKLRAWNWRTEVTEIHVARSDSLAGLTGLKPQRGVFIVSADKPEDGDA